MTSRRLTELLPPWARSLRLRVMLWIAGAVVVTALVVLFGVREGVRRTLVHELDQILIEDLREIRLAVADARVRGDAGEERWQRGLQNELDEEPWDARDEFREEFEFFEELDNQVRGHEAHHWFVRFYDPVGSTIVASADGPPQLPAVIGTAMTPFGTGGYRVVDLTVSPPLGRIAAIRIGASTELIDRDMRRIDVLVLTTAALILAVAPLGGYWLAGRALRPVSDIIDTASRLRPSRLSERLPDRGAGDELDKLADTINRMLDRIASYVADRRDFLANSAHELRSPLAAIRSTVEVALQTGSISPSNEETFSVVIDECRSLEHLVNQLLVIAETETEGLSECADDVALDRLVASSVDMFSAAADVKGIALESGPLEQVSLQGNRHHLRQLVNNLLDNALKFTPPGGTVSVQLFRDGGEARLIVADTGIGIPPQDLPHVFNRFFRGDRSRHRDGSGTGLGLSICQAVVTAHGGRISLASQPLTGTRVVASFPVADPQRTGDPSATRKLPLLPPT